MSAVHFEGDASRRADAETLGGDFGGDVDGSRGGDVGGRSGGDGGAGGSGGDGDGLSGRSAGVVAVVAGVGRDEAVRAHGEIDGLIFGEAETVERGLV